jgi:hypothetical protein
MSSDRTFRIRRTLSRRLGTDGLLSGADSGTSDGNPLLWLGSSMNVISKTNKISIIGVTLITAAVLLEPICIATQTLTTEAIEKFRRRRRYDTMPDG